ncbi:MAG: FliA/WhiG family RNA polymerase sigma factor [Novosphingopyxis baekryungensis]|jgi:RNA polymerase sigma factor for flagellar operon FliA|uniref:sigma-70 family RNA polymerase sigma factor n=1 Tax=Novosphingopyxis baekryungensis TaxID=279369 RepID=UPI0003B68801|nr:FliA/WhiG family RNA polymerase sigma factor [Novosphingopyxis baekryungensis]MDE0932568.1 FliA/WhiG family RNA polymerase sigma factor [Novosphingopyxis baekryungensis]
MNFQTSSSLTYGRKPVRQDPKQLIEDHIPLVRKIAWHVSGKAPATIEVEDLIQIGLVALIEAARRYEDQGHQFSTYAGTRIRGAMIDHLRAQSNLCRSALDFRKQLRRAQDKLMKQLGRDASEKELALEMGLEPAEFLSRFDQAADVQMESMDEVYSEHSIWFASEDDGADMALERDELTQLVAAGLGTLNEREQMVLQLFFIEELNLEEIGSVLGVTAARVCQIKKGALDNMRKKLSQTMD